MENKQDGHVFQRSKTSKRAEQYKNRVSGQSYTNGSNKSVPAVPLPQENAICKCKYGCKNISLDLKFKLREDFMKMETHNLQNTFLLRLLSVLQIKRRRHGTYDTPKNSRRQCTISYCVPNNTGSSFQVCKQTFQDIFAVSHRRLQTLQTKCQEGVITYTDKRKGNTHHRKYTSEDWEQVKQHVNSFPKDESHYGRAKSDKVYFSSDLNVSRLHRSFISKYPESKITYKFYRKVFSKCFPHVSFSRPRTDTCRTCDLLACKISSSSGSALETAKREQLLHHRKFRRALECMNKDSYDARFPNCDFCMISVDLQQVLLVPNLTHSNMYYSRQLSCYNLGIHISHLNKAFMCMWNETKACRGSNEVGSCILRLVNSYDIFDKNKLVIWSDNCAGQNKNRTFIFIMMFLIQIGHFKEIVQKFLISGHSFLACDRDFAIIEKRKRVSKCLTPMDLEEVVASAKVTGEPFSVVNMEHSNFFDFKSACDSVLKVNFPISKATMIKVSKDHPGFIQYKTTFSDVESWKYTSVLKKGAKPEDIGKVYLSSIPNPILSEGKKKDLPAMLDFLPETAKGFYQNILN